MRYLRVALILALGLLAPLAPEAQPAGRAKVPRIGVVWLGMAPTAGPLSATSGIELFRESLRGLGYVEGKTIAIESGFAGVARLAEVIEGLIELRVDLIVATSTPAGWVAKSTTPTVPVVFTVLGDPVQDGLVASLTRPGGNLTGMVVLAPEQSGRRPGLLREAVPRGTVVAALSNPSRLASAEFKQAKAAADALEVRTEADLEPALKAPVRAGAAAVTLLTCPIIATNLGKVANLCRTHRLPATFWNPAFAEVGGLMAYGASGAEVGRRMAAYVDRILKGAKPGDLPIQQPATLQLIINLKTAKALGLTIPPSLLVRADRVIQ